MLNGVVDEKKDQAGRNHILETAKQKMEMKLKEETKHNNYQTRKNKTLTKEVQQLEDQLKRQGEKFSKDLAGRTDTLESEQQQMETTLKERRRKTTRPVKTSSWRGKNKRWRFN